MVWQIPLSVSRWEDLNIERVSQTLFTALSIMLELVGKMLHVRPTKSVSHIGVFTKPVTPTLFNTSKKTGS